MKNQIFQHFLRLSNHSFRMLFGSVLSKTVLSNCFIILLSITAITETINAQCVLACPPMDPPREISIGIDCLDTLTLPLLGVVPSNCTPNFTIQIMDQNQNDLGDTINSSMINMTFMVVITNTDANQICMTAIKVIDKQKPFINGCPADTSFACTFDISTYDGTNDVVVTECSEYTVQQFDELVFSASCVGDTITKYNRTYVVTDEYNNSTSCTQMIALLKANLEMVTFPDDLTVENALSCSPPPDTTTNNTGAPMVMGSSVANGLFCNLSFVYNDVIGPLCSGGYKIIRTFTVYDWCADNADTSGVQIIEVLDKTPPLVVAPPDMIISANSGMCLGSTTLPPASITEDCSDIAFVRVQGPFGTMFTNGGEVNNLPIGTYDVIYIATNDCDSVGRDTLVITVQDNEPPSPVCHESVNIPVAANGEVTIPVSTLNAGSTDNCGPVFFKAKRMSAPIGYDCTTDGNPNYLFDDLIKFCCEDIPNNSIMVILRVYDQEPDEGPVSDDHLNGRWNECMMEVNIQDKLPPTILCPSDLEVSCQFPFDPNNLSVFGKIALIQSDQNEICIDDSGNPWTSGVECIGLDGIAMDNCSVTISEIGAVAIDSCGLGSILRTFTATDNGGISASCVQSISIINYTPFKLSDIIWPKDYSADDVCDVDALDPDDIPAPFDRPVLNGGECSLVSASYRDQVYDFSNTDQACFKIVREWTVIDWCQFDSDGGGQWTYFQAIKSLNTVPPNITSSTADIERCTSDPNCGPTILTLGASAEDDCSSPATLKWKYSVDFDNDLIIDQTVGGLSGGSISFDLSLPIGNHRIIYTVNDKCNNPVSVEQLVKITSCNTPSAKCIVGLSMPLMGVDVDNDGQFDGGMATIWATDFDGGSEHPCGLDISLAFSEDPTDISRTFTCDNLGENIINLYAIDENGLSDFCTTFIDIQDNNNVCIDPGLNEDEVFIAGAIATNVDQNISNAMMYLDGSTVAPIATNENGGYAFMNIPIGDSYTIMPTKDGDDKNGVSTLDLVYMQKHLLGLEKFDSPYKYIAADANNSGSVTALDIVELRKLILGIYSELPLNTSWRFVDQDYQFTDSHNPLNEVFPESYHIQSLASNMHEINFVGIKIGDLNGTVVANAKNEIEVINRNYSEQLTLVSDVENGVVTVSALNMQSFQTAQFTLEWDAKLIPFSKVSTADPFTLNEINQTQLSEGKLSFAWFNSGQKIEQNQVLFSFQINDQSVELEEANLLVTSTITNNEAVDTKGNISTVMMQRLLKNNVRNGIKLFQNQPNPFSKETIIKYSLSESEEVSISLFDMAGRLLFSRNIDANAGLNKLLINANDINAKGVVLYKIKTQNSLLTKRMIIE